MKLIPIALILVVLQTHAQKPVAVEDFTTRSTFAQKSVSGIRWMNDGKFYTSLVDNRIVKFDITTGLPVETILDGSLLPQKLIIENYDFSSDEKKIMILTEFESIYRRSFTAEYFVFDRTEKTMTRLSKNGRQSYATFSPDGTRVAFVRANNLFYTDIGSMSEVQITHDGKFNHIINGTTDWVYEEEFSFVVGFYWSPDSRKLAYYKFDESEVKEYNLQRWNNGQLYPEDYRFKYPKAGERNSKVEVWMYDLTTQQNVQANLGNDADFYVPRVKWTHDPDIVSIRKLDRLQSKLEILHTNASTGRSVIVLTEKSKTYVDIEFNDDLIYLEDGEQFIHTSEMDGHKHLYLYSVTGSLVRQISTGNFDVVEVLGFDSKSKNIFYISTEVSPLERHLYAITTDGKKKSRLTRDPGVHEINMSGDLQFFIDHHTTSDQPVVASLYKTKGNSLIKLLEKNEDLVRTIGEFGLAKKEFFTYTTIDGTRINGLMLKPQNFDSARQYPVLVYQYSGPGSQNVTNAWGGSHFYFHQMLTQKGYIVALIDPRGTGGRGEYFKKLTYKQLGKFELEDIIEGVKFLQALSFVDDSRIGIWGWSYGGYMSSLAMTKGAGVFKLGIAVAPVTNWRYYDTIYTERYLQTPQANAEGYDNHSPNMYADKLQGKFLLIHGTGDDNVHFQNSVVLQDALISAGKKFDSFYYPDKAHGISGGKTRLHLYTMMLDFVMENL